MAKAFDLSVVAPDRSVVEDQAVSVIIPGAEGYFGVQAGHIPMIAALKAGVMEYTIPSGLRSYISVGGGFAEVVGTKVTILADAAERADEIDIQRAQEALEKARRALKGEDSSMTSEEATAALDRAMTRVRAAKNQ
ncbi:MAG: F0F1 ATP synthase subunit epsilon [Fimbriimonadaceae bacterium]|nr:F0F1 ATP synthase subunit epsilon [Fimbriimonadaceae bacterium]